MGKGRINLIFILVSTLMLGAASRAEAGWTPSDRRLKEEIQDISETDALNFLTNSRPVHFKWKTGDQNYSYGFIAQDLFQLGLKDAIKISPDPDMKETIDSNGFVSPEGFRYAINYDDLIAILTQATRNLYSKVTPVSQDVDQLKNQHSAMKNEMETLKIEAANREQRLRSLEQENNVLKAFLCATNKTAIFCVGKTNKR